MTIIERAQSPTPGFFKKIRNVGLILASIGASILAAPIALPALVLTIAGYLTVIGAVASTISQVTTAGDSPRNIPSANGNGSPDNNLGTLANHSTVKSQGDGT